MQVLYDLKTINPISKFTAIIEFSMCYKKAKKNECWNWGGRVDSSGYGAFGFDQIFIKAHRFAYLIKYGSIPVGYHIHHKCKNKLCVNVKHLKSVTPEEHKKIHARVSSIMKPAINQQAITPWYRQKAERPKVNKTFSIYEEHSRILDRNYQGQQSALVRLLMDKFFSGQLPEVAKEFEQIRRK